MKKRAYKFRFNPTTEQAELMARSFGCVRFVWNNTLRWRTDAYYKDGESITHAQAEKRIQSLKSEFPWLKDVSNIILVQALRDQQQAYSNFWAGRAKYPNFKKRHSRQSMRLTRSGFRFKNGQLYIAKSKAPLAIRWSQDLPSEPSSITISKDRAGRYFVSLLCEFEAKPMPITPNMVGIDLGLNDLFITSDGSKSGNPRHTRRYEQQLAYAQQQLDKKQKGSKNRDKARLKVARLHARIADCRMDATHKATRRLINENQVVCVESLAVKNMIKNPKLAKHIADANWGEFVRQLDYKADLAGREVIKIDRFFPSSKRCSCCGYVNETMPLSVRSWTCPECDTPHDRDINAAKNILTAGLAGRATGTGKKAQLFSREGVLNQEPASRATDKRLVAG